MIVDGTDYHSPSTLPRWTALLGWWIIQIGPYSFSTALTYEISFYYEPFTMLLLYSYNLYTFRPRHVSPTPLLEFILVARYNYGTPRMGGMAWHETIFLPFYLLLRFPILRVLL